MMVAYNNYNLGFMLCRLHEHWHVDIFACWRKNRAYATPDPCDDT